MVSDSLSFEEIEYEGELLPDDVDHLSFQKALEIASLLNYSGFCWRGKKHRSGITRYVPR